MNVLRILSLFLLVGCWPGLSVFGVEGVLFGIPDPAIIAGRGGEGELYIFSTGKGLPVHRSRDLLEWTEVDRVFDTPVPAWAKEAVPGTRGVWAPDISYFNDLYHLYYSVSTFGSQRSRIGLAVNETLDPDDPDYKWVDRGMVIESNPKKNDYNAIDPAVFVDFDGRVYMFWGSYWTGIKFVELDPATGKPSASGAPYISIANREKDLKAIEGPYVIHRKGFYYLFVSWDFTMGREKSTYKVMVGRSKKIEGPYVDFKGKPMAEGGGTLVLASHGRWRGPGHNSILRTGKGEWMAHHTYDAKNLDAKRVLQIRPLYWGRAGWPVVGEPIQAAGAEPNPAPTDESVAGVWIHSVDYQPAHTRENRLLPNHRVNREDAKNTWSLDGSTLTFAWKDDRAPGGAWRDVVFLEPGGDSYIGRNQNGQVIRGERISGRSRKPETDRERNAGAKPAAKQARGDARPNIVLIMADDMGFSDIGCYGGEIKTPNLDGLAAKGLRFRQFYNTARCCPTRASLMTGLYPHQTGMGWMTVKDLGPEGYRGDLNRKCVTIAEALKQAGYGTYMSGKWHLTSDEDMEAPTDTWPCQRGFDRFFGTISGAGSFWTPEKLTRNNTRIQAPENGFFYTDAINDNACDFIRGHQENQANAPFFLYVAHTAPHWPLHAKDEDIAKYEGRYDGGWDRLREERHARMKKMGVVRPDWPLTPRDKAVKAWNDVEAPRRKDLARRMEIYAAQVDAMDQGIGRIVTALEETGRMENTLILFLSDNGGCAEGGLWGFERNKGGVLGRDSSFASYGQGWAHASNTPFRLYKHWVHEGGIATPLIAHWPKGIDGKGAYRDRPGHVVDIMATCLEVSGAAYPARFKGQSIRPLDGQSLVPAFADGAVEREAIFWEHEGNRAVRDGRWKLVAKGVDGPWELYDLAADRTETRDLATEQPDRVEKMAARWQAYAEGHHVLPLDGRSWNERIAE